MDRCARDLEDASKGPSAVDSIYIFSGAKDPCDGDSDQHAACEVFARDSSDVDRELQLYYFGEAEQVEDFWKPRILVPSSPPQDATDQWQERAWPALEIVDVFDAGRERARMARGMRGAKTVPGVELCLALGDDVSTCVEIKSCSWLNREEDLHAIDALKLLDGVAMSVPKTEPVKATLVDFHTRSRPSSPPV